MWQLWFFPFFESSPLPSSHHPLFLTLFHSPHFEKKRKKEKSGRRKSFSLPRKLPALGAVQKVGKGT